MPDFAARRTMMVDTQVRPSGVTKFPIIEAMLSVPREVYVPDARRDVAYLGENLDLGDGRVLLAPRTFAKMLEAIDITPRDLVLDVGCGLGYSTAVLARLAEAVVGLDTAERAAEAEALLAAQEVHNAVVVAADPAAGAPAHGPYDAILVQGGLERLPDAIAAQLKEGGRIVCLFMEGPLGVVKLGVRHGGGIVWRPVFHAAAPVMAGFARERAFSL